MKNLPGWAPLALVAFLGLAALVYVDHVTDPESVSWTDPQQPPSMVALAPQSPGQRQTKPAGAGARSYADSLFASPHCIVGDC